MNTSVFAPPPRSVLWKQLIAPAVAFLVLGITIVGWVGKFETVGRRPSSLTAIQNHYRSVWSDWMNIPAVCESDLPLTDGPDKAACDEFWGLTLSRAGLGIVPFLLMLLGIGWLRRSQDRVYAQAQTRLRDRSSPVALGSNEVAPDDLFSLLHCLKPAYVYMGGNRTLVYLSYRSGALTGQESLAIQEIGRVFGKVRRVATIRSIKKA